MKKLSKYLKTVILLLVLILITGLPAAFPRFCDWYTDHIYGILCDAISHITGLFPFALGEIIMFLGAFLLVAGIAPVSEVCESIFSILFHCTADRCLDLYADVVCPFLWNGARAGES